MWLTLQEIGEKRLGFCLGKEDPILYSPGTDIILL